MSLSVNETVGAAETKRDGRFRPGNPGGRGKAAMQARAREDEAAIAVEIGNIASDFGRQPSYSERVLVEQMAAEIVRSRRLRSFGRSAEASECTRLISRIAAQLGLRRDQRPGSAPKATPGQALREYLASRGAQAPHHTEKTHSGPAEPGDKASDEGAK
jgi:hypothetical protein